MQTAKKQKKLFYNHKTEEMHVKTQMFIFTY